MIDISRESLLSLREAARLRPLGRSGRPTHVSSVYRWISRGIRGIRLEAIRLGGMTLTSREALQRFAERLTAQQLSTPTSELPGDQQHGRHAIEQALDDAGL